MKLRVLMCATDAGGARNVAGVAVGHRQRADFLVYGNTVTLPFFREVGLDVQLVEQCDAVAAASLLRQVDPDVILCGRTRHASFDRSLINASAVVRCPSVVVLDEWYSYLPSFQDENGAVSHLPDQICVPDDMARAEAIAEGLPADRLAVVGSPALSALADRIAAFACAPPDVPEC